MASVIAGCKKVWITFYTALSLLQLSPVGTMVVSWAQHWGQNRQKIITLTLINTSITLGTEFVSRSVLASGLETGDEYKFLVKNDKWYKSINKQSLINVWMTFFASLIAAPVYFFRKRKNRFLFFVIFGTLNSFVSQGIISFLREGVLMVMGRRLVFDLFYNGSIKYILFEFFRRPIKGNSNIFKLTFLRGKQDLLTSFFKTSLLNLMRFKG